MKSINRISILVTLLTITSCGSPEKEVAERFCNCMPPLLELMDKSKEMDDWYASLSTTGQGAVISGQSAENLKKLFNIDIDTAKLADYRDLKAKAPVITKEVQSCINAVVDEYGDQIEDEEFKKGMRIEIREQCPDAASKIGI